MKMGISKRRWILPMVAFLVSASFASSAPWEIEPGSEANRLELTVANRSPVYPLKDIVVKVIRKPSWVNFDLTSVFAGTIPPGYDGTVTFIFDVDERMKPGSSGEIVILVENGYRNRWTKQIDIRVKSSPLAKTQLFQSYPNPFKLTTRIPFILKERTRVTIRIYNVSGQVIRTVNWGETEPGDYTSNGKAPYWDGRNTRGDKVASGLYFYELEAGSYLSRKRVVLLK
jgi:hypothetical protein